MRRFVLTSTALRRGLVAAVASLALPAVAAAQLGSPNPAPGEQGTFAIRNARIVPVVGAAIERGTLVISGGKITAVGANVAVPQGATVIDGTGLSVYPGMMDAATAMGLTEIAQGATPTVDNTEVGSFNPNAIAYYAMNPHSAHIGVSRVVGVTQVLSRPSGGVIAGQGTVANLAGWTPAAMTVRQRAALVIARPRAGGGGFGFAAQFGGGGGNAANAQRTRDAQLDSLRSMLEDARAYDKAVTAAAAGNAPAVAPNVRLAALVPYVRGELPVLFEADTRSDIRTAVEFAERERLKPIIVGGREAYLMGELLTGKNVPVIYTRLRQLPGREDDPFDINFAAPAAMQAAGITFAISTGDDGPEVRDLPSMAGMAAAYGLSPEDALRAVTIWPAKLFGLDSQFGSLEVGKVANVVVTTGDILEARTDVKHLFIDGRPVPLDTRHTVLYETHKARR